MATSKLPPLLATLRSAQPTFHAGTDEERELVRLHLERILGGSVFRNSRRYSSVLKFVVAKTLEGSPDELKERTIGVAVFGRAPDYDTTADHVVRSAVAEIRKRLAQYYQEDGCEDELRIELLPGSYVPQFRLLRGRDHADLAEQEPAELMEAAALESAGSSDRRSAWPVWTIRKLLTGVGIVAAMVVIGLAIWRPGVDPLGRFWKPLLSSSNPILLCVGDMEGSRHDPPEEHAPVLMKNFHNLYTQNVHLGDAVTLARIAGFLEARGARYRMVSQSEANYTDFQTSPTVLIGLLNNDWTKRLVGKMPKMRFTIDQSIPEKVFIRDRNAPSRGEWSYDSLTPFLQFTKDYALVLRVVDPKTDQVVVLAGGLAVFGTLAAGEFLTTSSGIRKLESVAPRNWARKNFELVLSTDVIRGQPGHATIVASHFW